MFVCLTMAFQTPFFINFAFSAQIAWLPLVSNDLLWRRSTGLYGQSTLMTEMIRWLCRMSYSKNKWFVSWQELYVSLPWSFHWENYILQQLVLPWKFAIYSLPSAQALPFILKTSFFTLSYLCWKSIVCICQPIFSTYKCSSHLGEIVCITLYFSMRIAYFPYPFIDISNHSKHFISNIASWYCLNFSWQEPIVFHALNFLGQYYLFVLLCHCHCITGTNCLGCPGVS